MKKLAITKRIIFALFAVLVGVNLWGKVTITGTGAENNPFVLYTTEDWNAFANNSAYWGDGVYVKLDNNWDNSGSPVTTMVGFEDDYNSYSGNFNGNGKTLYVNLSGQSYIAPFYYTSGATIENLTVAGSINVTTGGSYYGYSAGLIYSCDEETHVSYVTVSASINGGDGTNCGGFSSYSSYLHFENCVFNGVIVAGSSSGGFCAEDGYADYATFTDCIFAPAAGSSIASGATFAVNSTSWSGCYYTDSAGTTEQGTLAYTSYPNDKITKSVTVNGTTVYGKVDVTTTAEETYLYNAGTNYYSTVTGCTVKFDGETVTSNNYAISVKQGNTTVITVTAEGEYQLVITGKGIYHGTYTQTFYVVGDLTGQGTSVDPFLIRSSADWLIFANHVNNNETYTDSEKTVHYYSEAHYKLTNNITTTTMVGTPEHPFKGNFSGATGEGNNTYTLTFNCGASGTPTEEEIVAPFRYTDGATIAYLKVNGSIYTNVGKNAGLIGVNTRTSANTSVSFVIVEVAFYCYEEIWDAEGGGFAYIGNGVTFHSCAYRGHIYAFNYMGGFCGNADANTTFTYCLFNPEAGGVYWAENFVYNKTGSTPNTYYNTCYYTLGNNQEDSEQGTLVYVGDVPTGVMGKKLTELYGVVIYTPVTVVIGGVNDSYIYTGNDITVTPTVTFDGNNAITNHYCTAVISPTPVHDVGTYTLTVTAPDPEVESDYKGTITKNFYVVSGTSGKWTALQARLNDTSKDTIQIASNITAGDADVALFIPASRNVTIYLHGHTIDRGKGGASATAVTNGQVLRIAAGATVTIEGDGGIITGGYNKAANDNTSADNDGGGINNLGTLTLNNVIIENNRCVKKTENNTSATARGGGIYSGRKSTLTINGCEITNNKAEGGGGGMFVYQATSFTMNKDASNHIPYVHTNTSKDKGGGIRIDATGTTATINDCTIRSNTVEFLSNLSVSHGGGLHLDAGTLTMNNCDIQNNRASKYGGGIFIRNGKLYANNCTINYNMSYDETNRFEGYGGGVCIYGGKFFLKGATISNNSCSVVDGGGIFVNSGTQLSIEGVVNITENWKFINNTGDGIKTTNVYFVNSDDRITIANNITGTIIGVAKNGNTGVFTTGLNGRGTINNFSSDNSVYSIVEYDNEAKLTTISPVDPPTSGKWTISEPVILDKIVANTVTEIEITNNGCLYVNEGGYINGVEIDNTTNNAETKLVIHGGQVIPSNPGVPATVKKEIEEAYAISQENWYLISSPLVDPTGSEPVVYNPISITNNTNLIVKNAVGYPEYDLYRFNEGATAQNSSGYELQWENYDQHSTGVGADFTTLTKGRGYLYRNNNDYTITMTGVINVENSVTCGVTYHKQVNSHDNTFAGFNIIGNPYAHNITKGTSGANILNGDLLEEKYYVLDATDGSWDLTDDGTAIPPVTGILVQAQKSGDLTIAKSVSAKCNKGENINNKIWFTVANSKYDDKACIEFKGGHGLNKIAHVNENVPMLYIRHNDEDFASVDMNPEAKQFDLYFEAATMGAYKLSVNPQGNYSYLHLIDKLAEKDIDLLEEREYTFIGSPTDIKDRFVVRLDNQDDNSDNSTFAYQSGNEIVVSGEGTLQVFDVMGRLVAQKHVSGVQSITEPLSTGVYILRLNENTQKIVVK